MRCFPLSYHMSMFDVILANDSKQHFCLKNVDVSRRKGEIKASVARTLHFVPLPLGPLVLPPTGPAETR